MKNGWHAIFMMKNDGHRGVLHCESSFDELIEAIRSAKAGQWMLFAEHWNFVRSVGFAAD